MKHLTYLLFCIMLVACTNSSNTEDIISFERVDPFLKIFKESNFFPEYNETEVAAAGEHATFQFAIRSTAALKDLSIEVSPFTNEEGATLPAVHPGFVDYVRVSRQTPDRAKDEIGRAHV